MFPEEAVTNIYSTATANTYCWRHYITVPQPSTWVSQRHCRKCEARFFWSGQCRDVENWCRACNTVFLQTQNNLFQIFSLKYWRLNCKMATGKAKVPNNWKCCLSMGCQVDTRAHSVAPTFTRRQVEANFCSTGCHLCLSRPL